MQSYNDGDRGGAELKWLWWKEVQGCGGGDGGRCRVTVMEVGAELW